MNYSHKQTYIKSGQITSCMHLTPSQGHGSRVDLLWVIPSRTNTNGRDP